MNYETKPPIVSVSKTPKGYHTTVNFNIVETEEGFTADSATITTEEPVCENDYGRLVAAIVRSKYSADDVEAIQLNYMETKTTEHKNEFAQLKGWRSLAKETAKAALEYVAGSDGE